MQSYKIAVILPSSCEGESLQRAKNIARMIHYGSRAANTPAEVIFGHVQTEENHQSIFLDLSKEGIEVRPFEWETVSEEDLSFARVLFPVANWGQEEFYYLPNDGGQCFYDCDFWLFISDRISLRLAPLRPYGMVVYDYLQRYFPQSLSPDESDQYYIENARGAQFVMFNSPQTRLDGIQYAGIAPQRTLMIPMEFELPDLIPSTSAISPEPYFIWPQSLACYKNHGRVLQGLIEYYEKQKGSLRCLITGSGAEHFFSDHLSDEDLIQQNLGHICEARVKSRHPLLQGKIFSRGYLSEEEYRSVLHNARFLLLGALYDNGTFAAIESAALGVPILSSHYPQMKHINDTFLLQAEFFNPYHSNELSIKLKYMEEQSKSISNKLPTREVLKQNDWKNQQGTFWNILKGQLK